MYRRCDNEYMPKKHYDIYRFGRWIYKSDNFSNWLIFPWLIEWKYLLLFIISLAMWFSVKYSHIISINNAHAHFGHHSCVNVYSDCATWQTNKMRTTQLAKFTGPIWGPPGSCQPQIGPKLAPWTLLSGETCNHLHTSLIPLLLRSRFGSLPN